MLDPPGAIILDRVKGQCLDAPTCIYTLEHITITHFKDGSPPVEVLDLKPESHADQPDRRFSTRLDSSVNIWNDVLVYILGGNGNRQEIEVVAVLFSD